MENTSDTQSDAPQAPQKRQDDMDSAAIIAVGQDNARAGGTDIAERIVTDGGGAAAAADLARMVDDGHTRGQWVARCMLVKVYGRSPNTVSAKARDLATFSARFTEKRSNGDIGLWIEADMRRFLQHLAQLGRRPATINRVLLTLKHFARWVHEQPGGVFLRHGLPVADIECQNIEEPDCKELTNAQVDALFAAACASVAESGAVLGAVAPRPNTTVTLETRKQGAPLRQTRARRRRNLDLLGVLYYTGLRVSEVIAL